MDRVLMTGGTGFIGKYVVKELLDRGIEVTCITSNREHEKDDNISRSSNISRKNTCKYIFSSYNYFVLEERLKGEKFDTFIHLGWGGVDSIEKNDIDLQLENIKISVDMIRLSKKVGCRLFIGAGTVAEYVYNENVIDLSKKQTPNDVYGATKVACHYILEATAKQIGQDLIWAVLPSTYGEGRKGDNILTYTIKSLLSNKKPKYGKRAQRWDFLYVSEVARALVELGEKGKHNSTYGIGSGVYRTLKDYIVIVRNLINPDLELGIGELDVPEELSSCVDIAKLTNDTGFVPQISFEEGIRRTIEYYKNLII